MTSKKYAPVLIAGASVSGVNVAKALRSQGNHDPIYMVSREAHLPYDRPPLSKTLLTGNDAVSDVTLLTESDLANLDIRLARSRSAVALELDEKVLTTDGGERIEYGTLVIATGARPIMPAWAANAGAQTFRSLDDAAALGRVFGGDRSLAIIGAGFIGCEIAASARRMGMHVTLFDQAPLPMARGLDELCGGWFARLHRDKGVDLRLGSAVREITRRANRFVLSSDDGEAITPHAVIVAVGVRPDIDWLHGSGLAVADGVECDQYGRAIGADAVYAVGDAAKWFDPAAGKHVRHEHWTRAVSQAGAVAHTIVHPDSPKSASGAAYVWTDQYDWKAHIVGDTTANARTVVGDPFVDDKAVSLYHDESGQVTGAVVVNWPRAMVAARRAVQARSAAADVLGTLKLPTA